MLAVSKIIFAILNGYAPLKALVTSVQPVSSSQDTVYPFLNYSLSEDGPFSKEGNYSYNVAIRIFTEDDYDKALEIADEVKNAFANASQTFRYNGTNEPDYDSYGTVYIQQNYKFKN